MKRHGLPRFFKRVATPALRAGPSNGGELIASIFIHLPIPLTGWVARSAGVVAIVHRETGTPRTPSPTKIKG